MPKKKKKPKRLTKKPRHDDEYLATAEEYLEHYEAFLLSEALRLDDRRQERSKRTGEDYVV